MNKKVRLGKQLGFLLFNLFTILFCTVCSINKVMAQNQTSDEEQVAFCKIKVNKKSYELKSNQIGSFKRITNIKPLATIPIEITYPTGKEGEKVVISVEDGGKLDNEEDLKVMLLNNKRQVSFRFQVSHHPGIHRLVLERGNDTKMVQLWVSEEPIPVKK